MARIVALFVISLLFAVYCLCGGPSGDPNDGCGGRYRGPKNPLHYQQFFKGGICNSSGYPDGINPKTGHPWNTTAEQIKKSHERADRRAVEIKNSTANHDRLAIIARQKRKDEKNKKKNKKKGPAGPPLQYPRYRAYPSYLNHRLSPFYRRYNAYARY